ncbi:MAG TPA: tetratricopeptide repeat protein [Saprospiraceae bacterium]|nr:tetratricopeptide repeat protein [Saprospiraceae bacterium]
MKHLTKLLSTLIILLAFTGVAVAQDEAASAASLYNDGLTKLKEKDYGTALDMMAQALEAVDTTSETDMKVMALAQRNGAIAAYYSGSTLRKAEDWDAAIEAYDMGISMNPDFYANYVGRAQALDGKGDDLMAVTAFVEAGAMAEKSPKNASKAESFYGKAENFTGIAYGNKEYDKAIELAQAFLELRESADVYYYLAASQMKNGQASDALPNATKAAEMAAEMDDNGKFYMLKGDIHQALGQKADAVAAYKMITGGKYLERAKYQIDQLNK